MTFTASGTIIQSTTTTFTLVPGHTGDLILVQVINISNKTVFASSLSSSNVTWTTFGTSFAGTNNVFTSQVFAGKVTSTSSATVTVAWSGTAPSSFRIAGQEFSSSVGAWALDTQGHLDPSGTSTTWASLTPAGSGELYWGYCIDGTSAVNGSTSGYVYQQDAHENGMAYDLSCASGVATAPVWGDDEQIFGIMVLVKETSSSVTADAGLATGTGTAQAPVPDVIPGAGLASGTGTAQPPVPAAIASTGLAAGSGTAQSPVPDVTPAAALAAGTGTGQSPAAAVAASAGHAAGTGTSQQPVPVVIPAAGLAAGTGTALQPAVNTSGSTTANAGLASGTGTAQAPVPVIIPAAGLATGTGTAQQPAPAAAPAAGLAAGAGTAQQPVPGVIPGAGLATGAGTALNPAVAIPGTTANAGLATGTGTAQQPVPAVTATAGLAAGTGTALQPEGGAPEGFLFLGDGWTVLYYLDYIDLATSETLRAVAGNFYSMQAVNSRAGLTDPPPDGRWQGGMDMMEMMTSFRPAADTPAPAPAGMLAAARARNSRLQARLARGEKIADIEALISQGEAI